MKQKTYFLLLLFAINIGCIHAGQPIVAKPSANKKQMKSWAEAKTATPHFIQLADVFWTICTSLGIDPVVAYCQSAKETNYGKYTGVVSFKNKNTCGLKKDGAILDRLEDHASFNTWEDGVMAHVEHLALYAGAPDFPKKKNERKDTRHYIWLLGKAKTVEELSENWAVAPNYGEEIVKMMKEVWKY